MIPKHFSKLKEDLEVKGFDEKSDKIELSREGFKLLLEGYVRSQSDDFDSSWYLKRYPDIAKSIADRVIPSAKEHYVKYGYVEGRLPGFKGADVEKYISMYPDIGNKLVSLGRSKRRDAAAQHFVEFGYKEGRVMPS